MSGNRAIHTLGHLVGTADTSTQDCDGNWVRAVPQPYPGHLVERIGAAWAVIAGNAFAVRWPEAGDLEAAIVRSNGGVAKSARSISPARGRLHGA